MNCDGTCELKKVRITPPVLEFIDPFEGNEYKQTLEIQNVSLSTIFVRIGKPSSYSFEVKTPSRGQHLSPGLTIVKIVNLTYTHLTADKCFLPIHINEICHQYQIVVLPSTPKLTVTPQSIDFGVLHVGLTSAMRTIKLKNEGNKASRFVINISKKDPQLMAEPNKGILQPRSSIDVQIKLATFKKTTLMQEFWIACETPIQVLVKGSVIVPKFEVLHPSSSDKLSLLDFPMTYIGVRSVQTLMIRNYSATSAVFCVMRELNGHNVNLMSAKECDDAYKNFDVFPKDGHLEPKEARIIYFTFRPEKLAKNEKLPDFYMCCFHICRVPWKELDTERHSDRHFDLTYVTDYQSPPPSEGNSQPESPSLFSLVSGINNVEYNTVLDSDSFATSDIKSEEEKTKINVYLHGIAKVPQVTVVPDALNLTNLCMCQKETRVLEFTNVSDCLPIILRHKKLAYIDVEKETIFLKPAEKMQVSVYITPQTLGTIKTFIKFDLVFYDDPKVNNDYKTIGKISVPVRIDRIENVKKRYDCTSGIKNKSKQTSGHLKFAQIPELLRQNGSRNGNGSAEIGGDFKEIGTKHARKHPSDYSLTDGKRLLSKNSRCPRPSELKFCDASNEEYFIPLTPSELNEIIISPKIIITGEVACFHKYYFKVKVYNTSSNFIHLNIRADRASLLLPDGDRKIIPSNSELEVNLEYVTSSPGYYTASIDFIVNHSNVCVVTLLADVVLKMLKLNTTELSFAEGETYKYIDVYNHLNKDISFRWNCQQTNFGFDPVYGVVEAKSYLTCLVTYSTHSAGPSSMEAEFISGDKHNLHVGLYVTDVKYNYSFEEDIIIFDHIPLNTPTNQKAVLKNLGRTSISFTIKNPEPISGISLSPSAAIIRGHSDCIININVLMKTCGTFSCNVQFNLVKSTAIQLCIKGTVTYPNVGFTPNKLLLKKIPASSCDSWKFKVDNHSLAVATVNIDLHDYSEYKISKTKDYFSAKQQEEIRIKPRSSTNFFLYFNPSDVSCGSFHLPVTLNNLIGPPIINDPVTTKVKFYLEKGVEGVTSIEVPQRVPCVEIERRTTEHKIKISKKFVCFTYVPWNKKSKSQYEMVISNPQREYEEFCIRTDDLKGPFSLEHARGKPVTRHSCSIVCSLNPKEEVVLRASFNADVPGEYLSTLPVFLRNDNSEEPHTFLYFKGTYPKPLIIFDDVLVIMVPSLPKITISGYLTLKVGSHKENCLLTGRSDFIDIVTSIPEEYHVKNVGGAEFEIRVSVDHTPRNTGSFTSSILFECTCGGFCEVPVTGAVQNCYVTNHSFVRMFITDELADQQTVKRIRSLKSGQDSCCESEAYMRPPSNRDNFIEVENFFTTCRIYPDTPGEFLDYMNATVQVAENWVYTQGFFGQRYFKIPEDIEALPKFEPQNKNVRTQTLWIVPFVQLLLNLVGDEMITYLQLRPAPSTNLERILYCYAVYNRAITFLVKLEANLPHVHPEYLLDYDNYKNFVQNVNDSGTLINPSEFYLISKRAWLDLILQTYKVLILCRLMVKQIPPHSEHSSRLQIKIEDSKAADAKNGEHIFSTKELMLLEWLDFNYQLVVNVLWSKSNKYVSDKQIDNFDVNLNDGLVFAAVTITHCPYLKAHFSNLYLFPITREQNLHNAIKVTQAWEMLKLSFAVRPQEIVRPNALQMLMLVSYLYEVLPDLNPTENVDFKTGLSTSITKSFQLKNENQFETSYKVLFFNNENNCFSTDQNKIVLAPNNSVRVYVKYTATFLKYNEATLVLSGECTGYRYAKNTALILTGEPDVTHMTSVFTMTCYLYKVTEISLTCKSPYNTAAAYKLRIFSEEPQNLSDVVSPPSASEVTHQWTRRFYTDKTEYEFSKNGTCTIKGIACALGNITRSVWIYFRNSTVGDFAIRVNTNVLLSDTHQMISIQVPKRYDGYRDGQNKREEDNAVVYMNIPHQNTIMWNAVKEMALRFLTDDELEFWKNLLKTNAGIHLLQRLFLENKDVNHLFAKRNEYAIVLPKEARVSLPPSLIIEDEFGSGSEKVPIEMKRTNKLPNNFKFYLKSADGYKIRQYVTNFTYTE